MLLRLSFASSILSGTHVNTEYSNSSDERCFVCYFLSDSYSALHSMHVRVTTSSCKLQSVLLHETIECNFQIFPFMHVLIDELFVSGIRAFQRVSLYVCTHASG